MTRILKRALFLINVVIVTVIVVFLVIAFIHHKRTSTSIISSASFQFNPLVSKSAGSSSPENKVNSSETTSSPLVDLMVEEEKAELKEDKQIEPDVAVTTEDQLPLVVTKDKPLELVSSEKAKIEADKLADKTTEKRSINELLPDKPIEKEKGEEKKSEAEDDASESDIAKVEDDRKPDKVEGAPKIKHAFEIGLPTENRQLFEDPKAFYMHTNRYVDGKNMRPWQAGQYGYVRNQKWTKIGVIHTRLHEGIDIKPVRRDDKEEPLDDVVSISPGTVVHVNSSPYASSYGRYVVVKHQWPEGPFYSLYAHLATTTVRKGMEIEKGHILGRLGYSGVGLNRERAHVHLELAFMMSERFNSNYSPNQHGDCNGLNLLGLNVGRFLIEHNKNPELTIKDFLATEEPYFTVRTALAKPPGILQRHPWLGVDMDKAEEAKCWEITFTQSGVPLSFKPCFEEQSYSIVTWVKEMGTNHSYLTSGRLLGSGDTARLSPKGYRFINLLCENF